MDRETWVDENSGPKEALRNLEHAVNQGPILLRRLITWQGTPPGMEENAIHQDMHEIHEDGGDEED